jgi:hypothetical protein
MAPDEPADDQRGNGSGFGIGNFPREDRKCLLGYEILGNTEKNSLNTLDTWGKNNRTL